MSDSNTGKDVTIIYHDNCHDGITALWAVKQALSDAVPFAGNYSKELALEEIEAFRDRDIVLVDFCYKPTVMLTISQLARSVLILDHHKSAVEDILAIRNPVVDRSKFGCQTWDNHRDNVVQDKLETGTTYIYALFDMNRSGAGIAWDFFHPTKPRPLLIDYVEDRDLWRFRFHQSAAVHAACNCYPLTLEERSALMTRPIAELIVEGQTILRYHEKLVAGVCEKARIETVLGYDVPVVDLPVIELVSDVGNKLAKGYKFAAMCCEMPNGDFVVSLRSDENGLDVSTLAKTMGGGGHKNAAGYTLKGAQR